MSSWDAVFSELEAQLNFANIVNVQPAESRNRTTMHCQRLMPDNHVALAVPVIAVAREGHDDPEGEHVLAFTAEGPWLFSPARGNPGLPREPLGPIPDGDSFTFAPHDRHGGELTLGTRVFFVRNAYATRMREFLLELNEIQDQPSSD